MTAVAARAGGGDSRYGCRQVWAACTLPDVAWLISRKRPDAACLELICPAGQPPNRCERLAHQSDTATDSRTRPPEFIPLQCQESANRDSVRQYANVRACTL